MLTTNGGGPGNVQVLICAVTKDSSGVALQRSWILPAYGEEAGEANWDGNESGWASAINTILEDVRQNALFLDTPNGAANGDVLSWNGSAWVAAAGGGGGSGGGGNVLVLDPTLSVSAAPAFKTMTELLVARAAIEGPVEIVFVGAQGTDAGTYDLTECTLRFRGDISINDGTIWQNPYAINGGGYTLFNGGTGHIEIGARIPPMSIEDVLLSPTGGQALFVTTGSTVWDFFGWVTADGGGLPIINAQANGIDLRTHGPRVDISYFDIYGSGTMFVHLECPLELSGFAPSYAGTKKLGASYTPLVPRFNPAYGLDDSFYTSSLGALSYYLARYKPACAIFEFDGPVTYNKSTGEVALYNSVELRGSTATGQTQLQIDDNTYFHDACTVTNLNLLANGSVTLFQFSSTAKLELNNSVIQSIGAHPVITLPHKSVLIVEHSDLNTPDTPSVGTVLMGASATVTVIWREGSNIQSDVFVGPASATLDVYMPPGLTFPTQTYFAGTINVYSAGVTSGGVTPGDRMPLDANHTHVWYCDNVTATRIVADVGGVDLVAASGTDVSSTYGGCYRSLKSATRAGSASGNRVCVGTLASPITPTQDLTLEYTFRIDSAFRFAGWGELRGASIDANLDSGLNLLRSSLFPGSYEVNALAWYGSSFNRNSIPYGGGPGAVTLGTTHHVMLAWSYSPSQLDVYMDGCKIITLPTSTRSGAAPNLLTMETNLGVGAHIADIRISNIVRGADYAAAAFLAAQGL
jgi:hypothetical protein